MDAAPLPGRPEHGRGDRGGGSDCCVGCVRPEPDRPRPERGRLPSRYDRAYAAATLAGQLAELVYTLRTRAG